jgi:hypothetical protein
MPIEFWHPPFFVPDIAVGDLVTGASQGSRALMPSAAGPSADVLGQRSGDLLGGHGRGTRVRGR